MAAVMSGFHIRIDESTASPLEVRAVMNASDSGGSLHVVGVLISVTLDC
jgi:hypothetical protein